MIKDKKVKKKIWKILNKRLQGSCGDSCPKEINKNWSCMNCLEEFGFISGIGEFTFSFRIEKLNLLLPSKELYVCPICPCLNHIVNKGEVLLHLEEITKE